MNDEEVADAAEAEYRKLSTECEELELDMHVLGRTDVPLDNPRHIGKAPEKAQAQYHQLYKALTLKRAERDTVKRQTETFRRLANRSGNEGSAAK